MTTEPSRRNFLLLSRDLSLALAIPASGFAFAASAETVGDEYDVLRMRWVGQLAGGNFDATDPLLATALSAMNRFAEAQYAAIDRAALHGSSPRTGLWPDLSLGFKSTNVTATFSRIHKIALAYATPGGCYQGDVEVAADLVAALDWMTSHVYTTDATPYGNWWDWEVGSAQALLNSALLLHPHLTPAQRARYCASVDKFLPDAYTSVGGPPSTGANRTDICLSLILRGILGKSGSTIGIAAQAFTDTFAYSEHGDGLRSDGSYVFHDTLAMSGAYGNVWLGGVAKVVALLQGSAWAIADPKLANVFDGALTGFRPLVYNGIFTDAARGRAISRPAERDADVGFAAALNFKRLADIAPPAQAAVLKAAAKGWLLRNRQHSLATWSGLSVPNMAIAQSLLRDAAVQASAEPVGSTLLAQMDRAVHRRDGWAYALAMCSPRIARYESINGENLHGWHTGGGVGYLYLRNDPNQFTDHFWPTVDPYRLPGLTVVPRKLADAYGSGESMPNAFVGGTVIDGTYSAIGMHYLAIDSSVAAKKSWFCLDDCIVALGAGIYADGEDVVETIVENRNLGDPASARNAVLFVDGEPQGDSSAEIQTFPDAKWAALDGVGGYVFLSHQQNPRATAVRALREDRTGDWRDIGAGSGAHTRRYQSLWIDHGKAPTDAGYAYLLLPGFDAAQTAARARNPTVSIIANTPDVQAVAHAGLGLTAANFFSAGQVADITVSAPASVLVREDHDALHVAVSDPTQTGHTISVGISRSGYVVAAADPGIVLQSTEDSIQLHIDVARNLGASRSITLSKRP